MDQTTTTPRVNRRVLLSCVAVLNAQTASVWSYERDGADVAALHVVIQDGKRNAYPTKEMAYCYMEGYLKAAFDLRKTATSNTEG